MYNMSQYNYPLQQQTNYSPVSSHQQQTEAQRKVEEAFAPDPNSNQAYQQQFQQPIGMPLPQVQTYQSYPQVQTQINLQGMPPLTVNTPVMDPSKYALQ